MQIQTLRKYHRQLGKKWTLTEFDKFKLSLMVRTQHVTAFKCLQQQWSCERDNKILSFINCSSLTPSRGRYGTWSAPSLITWTHCGRTNTIADKRHWKVVTSNALWGVLDKTEEISVPASLFCTNFFASSGFWKILQPGSLYRRINP